MNLALQKLRAAFYLDSLRQWLPPCIKENIYLTCFGFFKVPMLFFLRPKVVELNQQACAIKIPLNRRSKNHVGCMYFGALAAGADCAGGMMAMMLIHERKLPVQLLFKNFKADFRRRAEGDVLFICSEGNKIRGWIDQAMESGERVNEPITIRAFVPEENSLEPVAVFELTLSLKRKG